MYYDGIISKDTILSKKKKKKTTRNRTAYIAYHQRHAFVF